MSSSRLDQMVVFILLHLAVYSMTFTDTDARAFDLGRGLLFSLLALPFCPAVLEPHFNLRLGEAQERGKLLALCANNVVVLFESVFQVKKLRWRKSCPDSLWPATRHKPCEENKIASTRYQKCFLQAPGF